MNLSDVLVTSSEEVSDDAASISSDGGSATDAVNAADAADAGSDSEDSIISGAVDPVVGEADDAELGEEEDPAPEDADAVTTYWFMVGDELYAEQTVSDGEAIVQPEDPAAPEGSVFAGWFLEDGTQLFVDGEEIVHADPERPFVNVVARFEDAAEPGEDEPADDDTGDIPADTDTGDTSVDTETDAAPGGDSASDEGETNAPDDESGEDGAEAAPEKSETDEANAPDRDQVENGEDSDKTESDETSDDAQSDAEGEAGETPADEQDGESETSDGEQNDAEGEAGETPADEQDGESETSDGEQNDAEGKEGENPADEQEDGEEIQPVRVTFSTEPEDAAVTVFAVQNNDEGTEEGKEEEVEVEKEAEQGEPEAVEAEEDGMYLLLPGEYVYNATAEGYITVEAVPFTVADKALEINIELEAEEGEKPEEEAVPFDQSCTIGSVTITVRADAGAFPAGAELEVGLVNIQARQEADEAIDEIRDGDKNVAAAYTYDIKVIDPTTGNELQPAEGFNVEVSFAMAQAADENLEASVYHVTEEAGDMEAQKLKTEAEGGTVTAVSEGFSLYTVEFTYNNLEYVLPGDESVAMSEILDALGLVGVPTSVEVSNDELFSATDETGAWIVTAHQAFTTTEWMKVKIGVSTFDITVTDAISTIVYQTSYYDPEHPDSTPSRNCEAVTANTMSLNTLGGSLGSNGWYCVPENQTVELKSVLNVLGSVNLILCDGAVLNAPNGIYVGKNQSLTIWGQSKDITDTMGKLEANGGDDHRAGIGGYADLQEEVAYPCGTIIINGGTINAQGGSDCPGIGGVGVNAIGNKKHVAGGIITINHGYVTATGGNNAAGIGGGIRCSAGVITINGGDVTATGNFAAGIGSGGSDNQPGSDTSNCVIINGGTVHAYGNHFGAGIGLSDNSTGGINIAIHGGNVTAKGQTHGAGIGGAYSTSGVDISTQNGTILIDGGQVEAIGGSSSWGIGRKDDDEDNPSFTLTLGYTGDSAREMIVKANSYCCRLSTQGNCCFYEGNTNYSGTLNKGHRSRLAGLTIRPGMRVDYRDRYGSFQRTVTALPLTSDMTKWDTDHNANEWYLARGEGTIPDRVTVTGEINLILCDYAKLNVPQGITVERLNGRVNTLNIYAASMEKNTAGSLTVSGPSRERAGIGGGMYSEDAPGHCGKVVINGGNISVRGGNNGAGIGGGPGCDGGEIYINNGYVTATGGKNAAGIGGGGKTDELSGGKGGTVEINGGDVTANASSGCEAIGHGSDSADSGELTLGEVRVYGSKEAFNVNTPVLKDEREQTCKGTYARLVECAAHGKMTYTITQGTGADSVPGDSHIGVCGYCGHKDSAPVAHSFTEVVPGKLSACVCGICQAAYVEADGSDAGTKLCLPVTGDMSDKGVTGGWYVVAADIEITDQITVKGTVNLILCDGATLKALHGVKIMSDASLTVWAQREADGSTAGTKMGALYVNTEDGENYANFGYGIRGESGSALTVNGGRVIAMGNDDGIYIGRMTVNGGNVDATGKQKEGIYIFGTGDEDALTVTGGTVTAKCGRYGIYVNSRNKTKASFKGGTVTASAPDGYAVHVSGKVTLDIGEGVAVYYDAYATTPVAADDRVNTATATKYAKFAPCGTSTCPHAHDRATGKCRYCGTAMAGTKAITLTAAAEGSVKAMVGDETQEYEDSVYAAKDETVTLVVETGAPYALKSLNVTWTDEQNVQQSAKLTQGTGSAENTWTFKMPAYPVTVTPVFVYIREISVAAVTGGTCTVDRTEAIAGDTVTINVAVTEEHYDLLRVEYDDDNPHRLSEVSGQPGVYTFQMPDNDVTVVAVIAPWIEHDGVMCRPWGDGNGFPEGRNAYLYEDVKLGSSLDIGSDTHLFLNGKALLGKVDDSALIHVDGGTLTICDKEDNSGSISNNGRCGSGIYIRGGTLIMNGGTVKGCRSGAASASGVGVLRGSFIMNGGVITDNGDTNHGAGVCVGCAGSFTMNGGTISGNSSGYRGGGVFVYADDESEHTGDDADWYKPGANGQYDGTFIFNGGAITGNGAINAGGGVYLMDGVNFEMSGAPSVTGNTGENGRADDIFLAGSETIAVTGKLTNPTPVGVRMENPGAFTSGLKGNGSEANFKSDDDDYGVRMTADGKEAELARHYDVTIDNNGIDHGSVSGPAKAFLKDTVALVATPETGYALKSLTITPANDDATPVTTTLGSDGKYTGEFTMPAGAVTVNAVFVEIVNYLDPADGQMKPCTDYTLVNAQTTSLSGEGTVWYVVKEDVELYALTIEGYDVNLILCDGATLNVKGGIVDGDDGVLTVWAQSADENTMGALTAGGDGIDIARLTLNGGKITAQGGDYGIRVDSVVAQLTINGGVVTAKGNTGICVYNESEDPAMMIVTSGRVDAQDIELLSTADGSCVTLTWNATAGGSAPDLPEVYATGYRCTVKLEKNFKDENGEVYPVRTYENDELGQLTLTPSDAAATFGEGKWLQRIIDKAGSTETTIKLSDFAGEDGILSTADASGALTIGAGQKITLDLDGCIIDRGLTDAVDGGNVITVNGALTLTGDGIVTGGYNTGNGGGVVVDGGSLTLAGGKITGNKAANGGGVYIAKGDFTLAGSEISDNTAQTLGGGVYVGAEGTFNLSGAPVIASNHNDNNKNSNVYLETGTTIGIPGDLSNEDPIGFAMQTPGTFTSGKSFPDRETARNRFMSEDDAHLQINLTSKGQATLGVAEVEASDGSIQSFGSLSDAVKACADATAVTLRLLTDATTNESIMFTREISLDLNGFGILNTGENTVIYIGQGVTLTLTDSDPNKVHYITLDSDGRGTQVSDSGNESATSVKVMGGYITGGKAEYGGAVAVDGMLNMNAGTIIGNTAKQYGGGVCVHNGTFSMTGGKITGNTASNNGGGLFVYDTGTFSISNAPDVTGNNANGKDNNVYLESGKTITVTGELNADAKIGVTVSDAPVAGNSFVTLTSGYNSHVNPAVSTPRKIITSDDTAYAVDWETHNDEAVLGVPIQATATNYEDDYDGKAHGITVTVTEPEKGATVTYSKDEGGPYQEKEIVFTDVAEASAESPATVFYSASAVGYVEARGSATVTINPIDVNVAITGRTNTAPYDGKAHKVEGYDFEPSTKLYTEDDFTFSGTAEASQTDVGTAYMGLEESQFKNENDNFKNVTFNVKDGWQAIEPIDVTVTVTGKTNTANYDGKEHKVSGYDFKASTPAYTANDFTFSGAAEAIRTDAGTAYMGMKADQFTNKSNPNFKTVSFEVTDGWQAIEPAPLTIIAEPNSKVEGETDPALTYEVYGLVKGESLTGSLTRESGELPGTYAITQGTLAASANYVISFTGADFIIGVKPSLNFNGDITQVATATPEDDDKLAYAWTAVPGAEGYDLYFKKCDGKGGYQMIETLDGADLLNSQVTGLKKGKAYKAYIMAWRIENGKKAYIGKASPYIHAIAGGFNRKKKICNAKAVSVKKPEITLAVGKKSKIKASVKPIKRGYNVLRHVSRLRYFSSDRNVAVVNKRGKITAVGVGTCTIYVVANNGVYKEVTVTVTN